MNSKNYYCEKQTECFGTSLSFYISVSIHLSTHPFIHQYICHPSAIIYLSIYPFIHRASQDMHTGDWTLSLEQSKYINCTTGLYLNPPKHIFDKHKSSLSLKQIYEVWTYKIPIKVQELEIVKDVRFYP